jgi:hypothetical protein
MANAPRAARRERCAVVAQAMPAALKLPAVSTLRLALISLFATGCASAASEPAAVVEVASAAGGTTAFQDGVSPAASYAGTRDTMIEQDHQSTNHGSDKTISASGDTPSGSGDQEIILLRWDITAIPSTAVVTSASIVVDVSDKADQVYSLYEALKPWDEATATWKRASTAVNWDSNGGDGAGDRGSAVLGTLDAPTTGLVTIPLTSDGLAAVQRWIANPATNNGVLIAGPDDDNRLEIDARESSKSTRPRLAVTWSPGTGVPAPGVYQQTCDGSAAVALDATHFLDLDDEDQVVRIYTRGMNAAPIQSLDISAALGMKTSDEADIEDAARIGNRVYAITSHGRNSDGVLEPTRYRVFAMDLAGTAPSLKMTVAGWSDHVVQDMLVAANWDQPDPAILGQLAATTALSQATVADLAPKVDGFNIEGLGWYPSASAPSRMIIGLRNPHAGNKALLISLLNADAVIAGATAHFGQAIELDLGGLGVRSIAWSDALQEMLIIGGPIDQDGARQLFTWNGDPASTPVAVQPLVSPDLTAAEAVVPYPGSRTVQVLFDVGAGLRDGTACKDLAASAQSFYDVTVGL